MAGLPADKNRAWVAGGYISAVCGFGLTVPGFLCRSRPLLGIGLLVLGLVPALLAGYTFRTGVVRSNWGWFERDRNPVAFFASQVFLILFTLMWIAGAILVLLGHPAVSIRW